MIMAKIGSWWLKGVEAEPDEQVVWSQLANRTQSSARAVGGKLFLTDRRLVFCPHWVDAAMRGRMWGVLLASVAAVGMAPKGVVRVGGGLSDRLRIDLLHSGNAPSVVMRSQ